MPAIREGERDYSRSKPISIPSGKSKFRHDENGKSSYSDRDSSYGSMQSPTSRVISNISPVRRSSISSYAKSPPEYYDEDKSGLDGMLGWSSKTPDRYSSEGPHRRSSDTERYLDRREEQSRLDRLAQEESRRRKKDIDGLYGWGEQSRRPVQPDPEPVRMRSQKEGQYNKYRHVEVTGKGSHRHYS